MQTYEVSLSGELTFESVREHAETLSDAIDAHEYLVVDLSACEAIDVAGAQLLISAAKSAKERGVALEYRNADRYRRLCEYAGLKAKGVVQG